MNDHINTLISEGKTEEAVEAIRGEISHLNTENRGVILASYVELYMKAVNEANRRYSKSLATIISSLKKADTAEKQLTKLEKQQK